MRIGDIAYDKSVGEIVLIIDKTIGHNENTSDPAVYKVITLDQRLGWEYHATSFVLEALCK
jgi:hypothetical protein